MSRIKIKNFGPIREGFHENDGWIDIKKVTVFIGNQGSGKSTVAKLISTLSWLEKVIFNKRLSKSDVEEKSKFQTEYCNYQNLKNYFNDNSVIEYEGNSSVMTFKDGKFKINDIKQAKKPYLVPKIMYVPAERNFISAVSQPTRLRGLPMPLYTFLDEFERSKQELSNSIDLPINNIKFNFDQKSGLSRVVGEDYNILLSEASSGLQASIPLFIVSKNLAEGIDKEPDHSKKLTSLLETRIIRERVLELLTNEKLTDEIRNSALELLSSLTKNNCFINIVEEPEQNLFPSSQWGILNSLLEFNMNDGNHLIMTTHSPYIINYLTLAVKAGILNKKIKVSNKLGLENKLYEIVPLKSLIQPEDLVIYELDETNGSIKKLGEYAGLPSDENYLNISMANSNEVFAKLLEIEDLCQ